MRYQSQEASGTHATTTKYMVYFMRVFCGAMCADIATYVIWINYFKQQLCGAMVWWETNESKGVAFIHNVGRLSIIYFGSHFVIIHLKWKHKILHILYRYGEKCMN